MQSGSTLTASQIRFICKIYLHSHCSSYCSYSVLKSNVKQKNKAFAGGYLNRCSIDFEYGDTNLHMAFSPSFLYLHDFDPKPCFFISFVTNYVAP